MRLPSPPGLHVCKGSCLYCNVHEIICIYVRPQESGSKRQQDLHSHHHSCHGLYLRLYQVCIGPELHKTVEHAHTRCRERAWQPALTVVCLVCSIWLSRARRIVLWAEFG